MCLILLANQVHPRYRLVLAANRDEFYQRPTAPASFWAERPQLLAGRDLLAGGTWFGVTRQGRIAALTNYREFDRIRPDAPSRGGLVGDYLFGTLCAEEYLGVLRREGRSYNGFNLVFGDARRLYCYCNKTDQAQLIGAGIHGLSNHLLDTPWPKVVRGKEALARALAAQRPSCDDLFAILSDATPAPDELLPDTGYGAEWERVLSAMFIRGEGYGTRSSTVLLIDHRGEVTFEERSFNGGAEPHMVRVEFTIAAAGEC